MKFIAIIVVAVGMLPIFSSAQAGPNCTCRFMGKNFQIGQVICIRGKLSQCEMALNNTSWKMLAEVCPEARAPMTPIPLRVAGTQSKAIR